MQDEHFMQTWNAGHSRFSADLARTVGRVADLVSRPRKSAKNIRNPYDIPAGVENRPTLSPAAKASLRGLAASLITGALWVVVMALATPAAGLAAPLVAPIAGAACGTPLLLA